MCPREPDVPTAALNPQWPQQFRSFHPKLMKVIDRIWADAVNRKESLKQDAKEREQNLLRDAAYWEERLQENAQEQRADSLAWEKAGLEGELKRKQIETNTANNIQKQKIEADMRTQISHIEAMERWEAEFLVERAKEKEFVTKEMQARMQLERSCPRNARKT